VTKPITTSLSTKTQWPAPAKLNLFLHITGQRDDGYHLLQTVFVLLDFADQLRFQIQDNPEIELDYQLPGVSKEQDIVYRAAHTLQKKANVQQGAQITLEKNLPMGGGLGGGSSDAATTLLALNHLWDCGLELADLAEIGLALGADVPVFIYGQNAWAFSDPQLIRDCPPITIRDFLAGQGQNVCEPIVAARSPEVVAALKALADSGAKARMTGTGACVFAAFDTETEARQTWSTLLARWNGFIAQGLDHSPVHEMLKSV